MNMSAIIKSGTNLESFLNFSKNKNNNEKEIIERQRREDAERPLEELVCLECSTTVSSACGSRTVA